MKRTLLILTSFVFVLATVMALTGFDSYASVEAVEAVEDAAGETIASDAGDAISGELIMIDKDLVAAADKNTSSKPVTTFEAGSYIYVTAQDDEWYEIYYQGQTLYAPKAGLPTEAFDTGAVTMEMMSEQVRSEANIMDYQAQLKAHRAGIVWKVLIIMIIAGAISVPGVMALTRR